VRIGIDLGGTKIEGLVLDKGGVERERLRVPTPAGSYEEDVEAIVDLIAGLERKAGERCTIGVAHPGAISPATGLVKNANSTRLNGRPLKADLERRLDREVRLANDANCFAVSEASDGAAAGCSIVFGVILGTGVGGGGVIDGVPYWDGGFRGNPPIWPFIYESESSDVVLVEVDPPFRAEVPQSNAEIADRLNEITFGGALMAEMRAIAFVQGLIEKGAITGEFGGRLKRILVHSIADPDSLAPLGAVSKFNVEPEFLKHLFDLGRAAATSWLAESFDSVGVKSTLDIRARFL
jgi:ROK family